MLQIRNRPSTKWANLVFWTWLAIAMQSCCWCSVNRECGGSGLKVTFKPDCCKGLIDSTLIIRYEVAKPSNQVSFHIRKNEFFSYYRDSTMLAFNLNDAVYDLAYPIHQRDSILKPSSENGRAATPLLPQYGFIIKNRPANFEYRISDFELINYRSECTDCDSYKVVRYKLNDVSISSNELTIDL